ncbi:DUF2500 domain-containing protein [Proteiniborus sp. MB09-C3]|nr:DUF2500 domain-containing protein [Proteiniborus sp. MB09-C3]WIV13968.1 DUF2500 domain-containing protein [Proteiniborus sp. MB09-C3]
MFNPFDDFMFSFVPIMIVIGFVVVISMFIIGIFKGIKQWNYNNAQPVLNVDVEIASKRIDVSHHHHNNDGHAHHHSSTSYFITFQVESGDRIELEVPGNEYGLMTERDRGKLKFQGTRYLGFERLR